MRDDQKNLFLAMGLSLLVIVGWNYFYGVPTDDKARQVQTQQGQIAPPASPAPTASPVAPGQPAAA
ncbi:MAG: rane protein insertase YidC, partial [Hyphomicrobiales bacterium]|nr:rane protein insertase YidC [Hyphomicrobiales bacterium]